MTTVGHTLFLDNLPQAALWELELQGQLSDGHWENSRPRDHWKVWCNAIASFLDAADAAPFGRNFYARRDRYALRSRELLHVVGARMVAEVRLALVFGLPFARQAQYCCQCADFEDSHPTIYEPVFTEFKGEYGRERVQELHAKFGIGEVEIQHAIEGWPDQPRARAYGRQQLLKDLRRISEAMRTYVDAADPVGPPA